MTSPRVKLSGDEVAGVVGMALRVDREVVRREFGKFHQPEDRLSLSRVTREKGENGQVSGVIIGNSTKDRPSFLVTKADKGVRVLTFWQQ